MKSGQLLTPLEPTPYTQGGTTYIQQGGKPTFPRGCTVHLAGWYTIPSSFVFLVGTTWLYMWISTSAGPYPVYLYPLTSVYFNVQPTLATLACSVTQSGGLTHAPNNTITLVSLPSQHDVQNIVASCKVVTQELVRTAPRDAQYIIT